MNKWEQIAGVFEENSNEGLFFQTKSSDSVLRKIDKSIKENFPQMLFLLGEPGSGKSFILSHLQERFADRRKCLLVQNPFISPAELLRVMLEFVGIPTEHNQNVEEMRRQAIEAYKDFNHIVMIDEAQLSNVTLREFIRILSDTKIFWFIIAMHTREGEDLLRNPHFQSRPHQVIYTGALEKEECKSYLKTALSPFSGIYESINEEIINKSYLYTKGNFRNFKKIYYNLFGLLSYAQIHERSGFDNISSRLLYMAAIKSALIENKKGYSDFDSLVMLTDKKHNTKDITISVNKMQIVILLSCILALSGLYALYNREYLSFSSSSPQQENIKENNSTKPQNLPKEIKKELIEPKEPVQKSDLNISQKTLPKAQIIEKKEDKSTKLHFYPPKIKQTYQTSEIKKDLPEESKIQLDNIKTLSLDKANEQEPNFLDTHEKAPIKMQISKRQDQDINELKKEYLKDPNYDLGVEIAKIYYDQHQYKSASLWAKKANFLNREEEEAWLLFAKSEYKLGNISTAIKVLELFLDYKYSQNVVDLLEQWREQS